MEYLQKTRSTIQGGEFDIPEQLEHSILDGGITQSDGTVSRKPGIRSRTARRWLHQLEYKWHDGGVPQLVPGSKRSYQTLSG